MNEVLDISLINELQLLEVVVTDCLVQAYVNGGAIAIPTQQLIIMWCLWNNNRCYAQEGMQVRKEVFLRHHFIKNYLLFKWAPGFYEHMKYAV